MLPVLKSVKRRRWERMGEKKENQSKPEGRSEWGKVEGKASEKEENRKGEETRGTE